MAAKNPPASKRTTTRSVAAPKKAAKPVASPKKAAAPAKASPKKPVAAKKAVAAKALAKPVAKKAAAKPAPKKAPAKKPAPPKAVAAKKPAAKAPARTSTPPPRGQGPSRPSKRVTPAPAPEPVRKPQPSPFKKGDKVVYPHHGAATIIATEKRELAGKKQDYFVLQVAIDQLILRVPSARAVDLGVRPVISKTAAKRVLAVFRTDPEEAGANWSRWYKLLTEKINSGDIFQVAEVVRDLTFAQQTKGISPALKRMLSKARMILGSELRFALDLSEEEAMKRLDKSLPKVDGAEEE